MVTLIVPAHGDLVVDGDGSAYRVSQVGLGLNCEGCGNDADFSLLPAFQSSVPVATVSYCERCLTDSLSDPSVPDTLYRAVWPF